MRPQRALRRLRRVGFAEGVSYLVLLGIAMPLKYLADRPEVITWVGWIHGMLFVLFVAALGHAAALRRWRTPRIAGTFIASLVPFGTFVLDRHLREELDRIGPAPVEAG